MAFAIRERAAKITHAVMPAAQVDSSQFTKLFQNLIGNALKFAGKETPSIQINARREATGWFFSVADNGIGMGAENLECIFEIFHRLHSREEYPGTGIGLALCKRIVEIHGGAIWAESEPGKGSVFSFWLPAGEGKA